MKKIIIIGSLCLILAACSERVRTVEYYQKHPDEANALLEKCMKPEYTQQMMEDPDKQLNCQRASSASFMNELKKMNSGEKVIIPKPNL